MLLVLLVLMQVHPVPQTLTQRLKPVNYNYYLCLNAFLFQADLKVVYETKGVAQTQPTSPDVAHYVPSSKPPRVCTVV